MSSMGALRRAAQAASRRFTTSASAQGGGHGNEPVRTLSFRLACSARPACPALPRKRAHACALLLAQRVVWLPGARLCGREQQRRRPNPNPRAAPNTALTRAPARSTTCTRSTCTRLARRVSCSQTAARGAPCGLQRGFRRASPSLPRGAEPRARPARSAVSARVAGARARLAMTCSASDAPLPCA